MHGPQFWGENKPIFKIVWKREEFIVGKEERKTFQRARTLMNRIHAGSVAKHLKQLAVLPHTRL